MIFLNHFSHYSSPVYNQQGFLKIQKEYELFQMKFYLDIYPSSYND